MTRDRADGAPARAATPKGMHDVLWPESARWEATVGALRRAGRGGRLRPGPSRPIVRGRRRLPARASARAARSSARRCTIFEDRDGQMMALRPEGTAPIVRAFVQHHPRAALEGLVRRARRSATRTPRPGATASTTSSAWRRSGRPTPTSTSRWSRWPTSSSPVARPAPTSTLKLNSMGDGGLPPGYVDAAARVPGRARRPALPRRTGRATWRTRCGSSTARREECRSGHRGRAALPRPPVRPVRGALRPGAGRPRRARACPTCIDHRLVRGFDYYTRTTFEFAAGALDAAQNGIGGGGRYDGLVEMLGRPAHAGHRLRHRDRAGAAGLRRRGRVPGRRRRRSTPTSSTWPAASRPVT